MDRERKKTDESGIVQDSSGEIVREEVDAEVRETERAEGEKPRKTPTGDRMERMERERVDRDTERLEKSMDEGARSNADTADGATRGDYSND